MPKKFLTVQEVARLLGVTPLTIRNWDAKGKLIAYRNPVNNYRMYKNEDVETILRQIEQSRDSMPAAQAAVAPVVPVVEVPRKLKIDIEE